MTIDQDMLFGAAAVQEFGHLADRWDEIVSKWSASPGVRLSDLLVERGWISHDQCQQVWAILQSRKEKNTDATSQDTDRTATQPTTPSPSMPTQAWAIRGMHGKADGPSSEELKRFEKLRDHAKGGLGIIYQATDKELDRMVALKQIRSDKANDLIFRNRFVFEGKITGQLEHPGIVPVYSLGTDATGQPYYAMRFLSGTELRQKIDEYHRLGMKDRVGDRAGELRKMLDRFVDVCNVVAYAHSKGILHRDIKPRNIMLGKYGETWLVDWGLARRIAQPVSPGEVVDTWTIRAQANDETQLGEYLGTPGYSSPEQLYGDLESLGPTTDVFSLGVVLYEILTGKLPIEFDNTQKIDRLALARSYNESDYPKPSKVVSGCPRPLEAICLKAMAGKVSDRYPDAVALRADVERWLADEAVEAYSYSWWEKRKRWVKSHPTTTASGVWLAFLSLALLFAINLVEANRQMVKANRQMKAEQVEAINSRADAESVSEFVTNMLLWADPDDEKDTPVLSMLRDAESSLEGDKSISALRRMLLSAAIMDSYLSIGEREGAERLQPNVRQLIDEVRETHPKEAAIVSCKLAGCMWSLSDERGRQEAYLHVKKSVETLEKYMAPDEQQFLLARGNLAFMEIVKDPSPQKALVIEEIIEQQLRFEGASSSGAFMMTAHLAGYYINVKQSEKGIALLRSALIEAPKRLGESHSIVIKLWNDLGNYVADPIEAEQCLTNAYDLAKKKYGIGHRLTILPGINLAAARADLGRFDHAAKVWDEIWFAIESKSKPSLSLETQRDLYVFSLLQAKRYVDAESMIRKWLKVSVTPESEMWTTSVAKREQLLIESLIPQNKLSEAEELLNNYKAIDEPRWHLARAHLRLAQGLRDQPTIEHLEAVYKAYRDLDLPVLRYSFLSESCQLLISLYREQGEVSKANEVERVFQEKCQPPK